MIMIIIIVGFASCLKEFNKESNGGFSPFCTFRNILPRSLVIIKNPRLD